MDPNDIDQTQAIFLEDQDEDDGTDELLPETEKQPKSYLKVLFQKGLTEKAYPLYEGENVIGRNADTCHVCIPSKALSKEHACIEIIKDSHLIYDKGSRNKTKRGKLFLSPNVRYELKSDEEISLADIKCIYIKESADCLLDGSETDGSESFLLQMDISKEKNTSALSPSKASMFDVLNDNKASDMADKNLDDDDSIIVPTQTFAQERAANPALCVQETPEREHAVAKLSTVVLSESESDDEERDKKSKSNDPVSRLSTGTAVLCGDSDSSVDSEKFCMATQAYLPSSNDDKKSGKAPSPDNGKKTTSSKRSSEELTQVCNEEEATQACLFDEPTQAFLQKSDGGKESKVVKPQTKRESTDGTQSFDPHNEDNGAGKSDQDDAVLKSTQVFEEEEEDDENEDVAGLFAVATMAPDDFSDEDEDEDISEKCEANDSKSVKQSTKNDATLPVSTNSTEAPTQATEETQKIEQKTENNNVKILSQGMNKKDTTQDVTDTVVVSETMKVNCSSANTSRKSKLSKKSTSGETATLVFNEAESSSDTEERDNDSKSTAGTLLYGDAETDTQPYGNKPTGERTKHGRKSPIRVIDEPTQAYGNDVEDYMATQQYGDDDDTKAGGKRSNKELVCNADEPTQAYESDADDATQFFDDIGKKQEKDDNDATQTVALDEPTHVVALDEPTQKIDLDEPTQKIGFEEPTQVVALDEPTQKIGLDEPTQKIGFEEPTQVFASDEPTHKIGLDEPTQKIGLEEPTQKFGFEEPTQVFALDEPTQKIGFEEPTQKVDFEEPTQKITIDEPTQKFEFPDDKRDSRKEEDLTSEDDSDLEETSMLKTDGGLDNEATQVFDMKPASPDTVNKEIQPTLQYNMEAEEKVTSGKEEAGRQADDVQQPTLKYDMEIEDKSSKQDVTTTVGKQGSSKPTPENPHKTASSSSAADSECYSYPLSPCLEDIGKDDSDNDTQTTPMDADTQPKSPPKPLPASSPLKSALVDRKRSPSPSPKRVAFKETAVEITPKENVSGRSRRRPLRTEILSGKGTDQSSGEEDKESVSDSTTSEKGRRKSKAIKEMETADETVKVKGKKAAEENVTNTRRGRRKRGALDTKEDEEGVGKETTPLPFSDSSAKGETLKGNNKKMDEEDIGASKKGRRKRGAIDTKEDKDGGEKETTPLPSSDNNATVKRNNKKMDEEDIGASKKGRKKRGAIDTKEDEDGGEKETTPLPPSDSNVTVKGNNKLDEEITGASKKGRRKRGVTNTKEDPDKDQSESETLPFGDRKTTEKTAKEDEKTVDKESIESLKRGRRKRGTTHNEDEEKMETDAETFVPSDHSNASKDSEKKSISEEKNQAKSSKGKAGKALKGQKVSGAARDKISPSNASEESDLKSTSNEGKAPKSSGSKDGQNVDDSQEMKQLSDTASETNESLEAENTNRRSGRRTVKNSMYKDFETGGKKRESLTKQAKTRGKKGESGPVQKNDDGLNEAKEFESDMGDFVAPAVLPTSRKRKAQIGKEDDENQPETTQEEDSQSSTGKMASRGKRRKPNNAAAVGVDKEEIAATTSSIHQEEKSNRKRSRASAMEEIEKPVGEKDDNNDQNLLEKNETPSQKKGAGKRGAASKRQAKGTPAKDKQKTDQVAVEVETEETSAANVASSNKRGRNSSKVAGKEAQKLPEASVPKGRRGAAASNKEDTPVTKGSQDSNRGKRKKTSSQEEEEEEEEISSTPAKRSRPSITSVASSPVLRHSTVDSKPKVMFTGVIDEQGEKTVKELGGELVTNIHECSHLVTDKIRRTVKFLGGLAKGVFIVSQQWLDNSKRAGTFLDGQKYLIKDQDMEKQFKFNLANSIASSKKHPLFSGFQIHVSKSVKPDPNQMKDILQCAGAEMLSKMPTKSVDKIVVVSCPNDEKLCKAAIKAGIPVVTAEFVLTGILQQNVDLDAYRLFQ